MRWLDGPPGLAEARLLEAARAERGELWWIALPAQRRYYLWRLGRAGARLGVRALHFQWAYYQILAEAGALRPVLGRGGRIARVARALEEALGSPPAPGEAVLYTRGIAEAKRHGLGPDALPDCEGDPEVQKLVSVYRAYEAIKHREGVWDADDVRIRAVALAEAGRVRNPDAVFVAGFFALYPLELRFLKALARLGSRVVASRPAEAKPQGVRAFRAENPAAELRWAIHRILKDIEAGIPPHEIALVVPAGRLAQAELLAREYGLYLMREAPRPLAESPSGQAALALARFAEHPTPEGLFWFPELRPLAEAALARGIAGREALEKLAGELGFKEPFLQALEELAPGADLAERVLARLKPDPSEADVLFRLWREALEADPKAPEAWWEALLRAEALLRPEPLGVALLTPEVAVGRRYRKAYVLSASEGTYRLGEREDYFFPEDCRTQSGLYPRLAGHDRWLMLALLHLGEEVWVSYPETEGGEVVRPEKALIGEAPVEAVPAHHPSRPLARRGPVYRRALDAPPLPPPRTVGQVQRYARTRCGLRYLLERRLPPRREDRLGLDALAKGDPEALAAWKMPEEVWKTLRFKAEVPVDEGLFAWVHALSEDAVYEFAEDEDKSLRWDTVLAHAARGGRAVRWVWGRGPMDATEEAQKALKEAKAGLARALQALANEKAKPRPGWGCTDCPYLSLCREGER